MPRSRISGTKMRTTEMLQAWHASADHGGLARSAGARCLRRQRLVG